MNRKRIIITLIFLVGVLSIFTIVIINKKNNTLLNNYLNNGSNLAFYYETETGEYTLGESFASLDGFYSLNMTRSSCDNGLDTIEWDNTNKRVIMSSGKSNRCKLYFDINKRFTLLSYYPITGRDAQITNMIKNGDYENGENNWSNSNASVTSAKFSHGKNSLQLNGGQLTAMSRQTLEQSSPTFNHTYYGRLMFLSSENFTTADSRFEWHIADDTGGAIRFFFKNLQTTKWVKMSSIFTLVSDNYVSSTGWSLRNFQVNPNEPSYTDELMMIDLTAGFGENIPSKEELDSELMYFDGTVDIKSAVGRNGVFTVSNLPEDAEIECSNGGNAQISGNTVTITGDSAQTTCYIKEKKMSMIEYLLQKNVGDGQLLQHTSDLSDSAGDDGYCYSGNQPNNYICFGKGSEEYNNGTPGATCNVKNKYRIIGYVPVTVGGETKNLVKVIKAEYLTEDEFVTKAGTASTSSSYAGIKRIEAEYGTIPAYKWNDTANNNWRDSSLYTSLNSSDYIDKAFGENWKGKIETVKWNVGGASTYKLTAQKMYEAEMTGQGVTTQVDAQIGLMYAHDYGFASSSDNWQTELYNYDKAVNRNNNWLFNGVYEWTLSRDSSRSGNAYYVNYSGYVGNIDGVVSNTFVAVRPVFYLKSDVNIKDPDANGSRDNPFRIAI